MTREEMIADAIELMKVKVEGYVENGGKSYKDWTYAEAEQDLSYLEHNLPEILKVLQDSEGPFSYGSFFKELGSLYLLSVPIKLWNPESLPSMQIRWDRFLHWFRGYSFQVSGSPDGDGDYGSSSTTMAKDLEVHAVLDPVMKSLIAFSHVCQATNKYDEFFKTMAYDPLLFNDFMQLTNADANIHCDNFDLNNILGIIQEVDDLPRLPDEEIFLCEKGSGDSSNHSVFAVVAVSTEYVAFGFIGSNKWTAIGIPEYVEGEFDKYSPWEDISKRQYYMTMWKRLVWILMSYNDITANYQYVYPHRKGKLTYIKKDRFGHSSAFAGNMGELEQYIEKSANEFDDFRE